MIHLILDELKRRTKMVVIERGKTKNKIKIKLHIKSCHYVKNIYFK